MSVLDRVLARRRGILSRVVTWPLALLVFLASSRWEVHPALSGMLFLGGCILVAVATIGRLWCSLYICGYKTTTLVTSGPYSVSRNPLYFFSAVGAIGVGLATETITIPVVLAVLFAVVYPTVIRTEEENLATRHREAYAAYVATVPRFWPRWSRVAEPETYVVAPAKFRRAMFDALWFVWLVGIIEFAEALREAGLLPTLLRLY